MNLLTKFRTKRIKIIDINKEAEKCVWCGLPLTDSFHPQSVDKCKPTKKELEDSNNLKTK